MLHPAVTLVTCRHRCPKDNLESGESGEVCADLIILQDIYLTYSYVDKYWVGRQSDVVSSGETCVCQIFTPGRYYRLCIDADGTTFPQIPGDTGVTVTCPMLPSSAFAQSAHLKMNGIFTAALSRSGVHDTGGLRTHLHHSLWSCCRGRGWGMQLGTTCFPSSLLLRTIRVYIYITL